MGGILDGAIYPPGGADTPSDYNSVFTKMETGSITEQATAVVNMISFNYPWLKGNWELVAWIFRIMSIIFMLLLVWDLRRILPFYY